ncbi:MAG: S9 family peptidase, partial [Caldilineaceae bacterium]|nr:S9 family peptidase [Caldilineaceae bacterium]
IFGDRFGGQQVICVKCDPTRNLALFSIDPRTVAQNDTYLVDLVDRTLTPLGSSPYGNVPLAVDAGWSQVLLADQYTFGDTVLYRCKTDGQDGEKAERSLCYGIPLAERTAGEHYPLTGFGAAEWGDAGILLITALFDDHYGLGYLPLATAAATIEPVTISGLVHTGEGELVDLQHCAGERYFLTYNIDGVSWVYEGTWQEHARQFGVVRVICGQGLLADGVLEAVHYEPTTGRYSLAFSTATTPAQLYLVEPTGTVVAQTAERLLGLAADQLATGEDASYSSHDGSRISARLYLPAESLGYHGKRPVVFYIHGGPQSQERPDFTWFSMPLIQFLTLSGFAVWVPNVRGSTGYGLAYMKQVDHDWGGQDRLDHVAAFAHLRNDERLDMDRVGVMGRSYGGYMTLTLAGRHPELWKAAVDMFGPYDLFSFLDRLPETWKTYFYQALGHPAQDREFLIERSPSTHLQHLACPMLVIQGANDPRVVEQESRDLVETLRAQGKAIDYLVFPDEGHDVLKYVNKVMCYNRIVAFFQLHLTTAQI